MRLERNRTRRVREPRRLGSAPSARRLALALLTLIGAYGAVASTRTETPPTLAGTWRLQETTGDLPEQAARALDGTTPLGATVTIGIEQTEAAVTVRRLVEPAPVLRVLSLAATAVERQVRHGGALTAHAEWRGRALVANGRVAVKQGFLTRTVPFEEVWQLDESGQTLKVTTTLKTPLGLKRRAQVFVRVMAEAKNFRRDVNSASLPSGPHASHTERPGPMSAACGALPIVRSEEPT